MKRHGGARRAFLLVEALLAIVVVSVALVGISRALGASLGALSRLQQEARRVQLAEAALHTLEATVMHAPVRRRAEARFDASDADYEWEFVSQSTTLQTEHTESLPAVAVVVRVRRAGDDRAVSRLQALWPVAWVQE